MATRGRLLRNPSLRKLLKAALLVRSDGPDAIARCTDEEANIVRMTNCWANEQDNIVGIAVGLKNSGRQKDSPYCIRVFVRKKKALGRKSKYFIRGFRYGKDEVLTDVVEVRKARLDSGVGGRIGRGGNMGSICALLASYTGQVYALSAAHVLGESFDQNTPPDTRIYHRRGTNLFDGNGGYFAQFADRRLLDYSNEFPGQNIDAAIALLVNLDARSIDRSTIPYVGVGRPIPQSGISLLGAASGPGSETGEVMDIAYEVRNPRIRYSDRSGRLMPIRMLGMCRGTYGSNVGDSGGAILDDDGRLVGLHIGHEETSEGAHAIFLDITRALGSWPMLRIITQ